MVNSFVRPEFYNPIPIENIRIRNLARVNNIDS